MRAGTPIGKIARRLEVAPTLKAAKVLSRRSTPPGQHGKRRFGNRSVYGIQLIEKQKLKFQFMLTEKALRRAFKEAQRHKGSTGQKLIQTLDERLDATLFRAGVVRSIPAARQLISHRHVFVNGRRVDKPSYRLKLNDVISFSEKSKSFGFLNDGFVSGIAVPYLAVDRDQRLITRSQLPSRQEIPVECNEQMIVEWYSR
ncbi:MAG: 30S ribosomal protein S4 [Bdellovibrionales bacterium]|nr:30S ribosomal protein S4 [Bdellovibrionales bacterium]